MTVPWKIHGPHAWMQSSKPSFMAIWLAGQFVTRCPQPCPFQCSFLCPCLRICVCVFLQLSEVEDARGGYHTITHALLFVFPITACLQFRQVLEPFLSHEWLLGPWWCVWMAAWSAGHAIVWFQKVAARPAGFASSCLFFRPIHIRALASSKTGRRPLFLNFPPFCARVHGLHVLFML